MGTSQQGGGMACGGLVLADSVALPYMGPVIFVARVFNLHLSDHK